MRIGNRDFDFKNATLRIRRWRDARDLAAKLSVGERFGRDGECRAQLHLRHSQVGHAEDRFDRSQIGNHKTRFAGETSVPTSTVFCSTTAFIGALSAVS